MAADGPIRAAVFDIGATLVTGPPVAPNKVIAGLLTGVTAAEVASVIMTQPLESAQAVCDALESRFGSICSEAQSGITQLWESQACAASALDGASETVRRLKSQGLRIGLLSDIWTPYYISVEKALPEVVAAADAIVLSCRTGHRKPEPANFLAVLKGLDVKPAEAVMIGDTYEHDILPAIELGMQTMWVLCRPDREAESLKRILNRELPLPGRTVLGISEVSSLNAQLSTLNSGRWQMEIERVEQHSADELIANMRRVGMLTHPEAKVYEKSVIELVSLHTDEIAPAQRYVLTHEIMKVRDLRWALREHGVDLFKLDGYVTIWLQGYDDPIDVLPPVIEQSAEADGSVVKILNDGMHRVYLARMERSPIQVVYCRNVPKEYPYYAFPLVDGWRGVEIVQDLPEGYIKKWHRIKNYKTLYRDFNTGFQNVGGPRGHFSNAGKGN